MMKVSEKGKAILAVVKYRPAFTIGIVFLSFTAAALEGVGLSFIIPVIELARPGGTDPANASGILGMFVRAYRFLGVPFTLESIMVGVGLMMILRYASSFSTAWLRSVLSVDYERWLKRRLFESVLDARIAYFDRTGSDEIMNAIVKQASEAGRTIYQLVAFLQMALISATYLMVALVISPRLTALTVVVLGGVTYLVRNVVEPGYAIGDRLADANEEVQTAVQAGTQGIRDVKLFRMGESVWRDFADALDDYASAKMTLRRNQVAINNFQALSTALIIFGLIYVALKLTSLSLGGIAVFLFAMFRLGPNVSNLNDLFYSMEGQLPHLVRTREFIDDLEAEEEPGGGTEPVPDPISAVELREITFAYAEVPVLRDVSFSLESNEFVAFVGQSGAGKSTVVSLIARLYDPDEGEIGVDGTPLPEIDLDEWRSAVAVVRQNPYVFDDTLRFNLTLGRDGVPQEELDRVCEVAQVMEFLDDLPAGYETELGDDGVRLSGGQKQRVALARALLKDAQILVLDEATSDLDTKIERTVQRSIESSEDDRMLLVVAHRLSTVRNADRIYVMDDGEVIEVGSHEELIEADGTYADLYANQRESVRSAD
ncbi:ABC transporter ATP-binding protein [Halobacteriales archaeon QS_8_69_26]|nr:MAG: ABC transporter ATP-binding protein [Halobacteriales archaeon QS_8_69_26]